MIEKTVKYLSKLTNRFNPHAIIFSAIAIIILSPFIVGVVFAETVNTQVTIGNDAPTFIGGPLENPASYSGAPTDVGADVTFDATGADVNLEDYYLAVCTTDAVTANNSGAPTCDVGTWCISGAVTTDTNASCSYTVQTGDTSETYAWYAFVCDGNSSSAECSTSDQGTGDSGSTFSVNHPPDFPTISSNSPQDPGSTVTFSTDASTLDSDTDGVADTVKLLVCATAGITAGACDGTQLCASSLVANNPSCGYTIPTPTADGAYDAYVYVVDSHNLGSTDVNQGSNEGYTVNNVAPVVSNVVINGGSDIDLTESTTTNVDVTYDVTDNNGCGGGELTTTTASLYRSAVTYTGCDINGEDDYDDCYAVESCSEDSCVGAGASYTCTVAVQYHADPTDTSTEFDAQNWLATGYVEDDDTASDTDESAAGKEINSLTAMDISSSIDYGLQAVGTNSGNLDQITSVTATGNVGLDEELSGTDMWLATSSSSIAVDQQRYGLSAVLYSAATDLTGTATEVELDVPKTRSTGTTTTPESADTYWGIEIPGGTIGGVYYGITTVTAIKSESGDW